MILYRTSEIIPVNSFLLPSHPFSAARATFGNANQMVTLLARPWSPLLSAQSLWVSHTDSLSIHVTMVWNAIPLLFFSNQIWSFKPHLKHQYLRRPSLAQKTRSGLPVRVFVASPMLYLSYLQSVIHCFLLAHQCYEERHHDWLVHHGIFCA